MDTADRIDWDMPAAQLGETIVSLREALRFLHLQGQLIPALREAARRVLLLQQAHAAGLTVSEEELQQAADQYRQRHGLFAAADTHAWMERQFLSKTDFEGALAAEVALEKLKHHVTEPQVSARFEARPGAHDRLVLSLILVPQEDQARELLTQIHEEGADLAELARRHSQHPSRADGGRIGPLFRRQLTGPLAEALAGAAVGTVVGPVQTPEGFCLVRLDEVVPGTLDSTTRAALVEELYAEWLNQHLGQAAFSAPILNALT